MTKPKSAFFILAICGLTYPAGAGQLTDAIINPANGHWYYLLSQNNWTGAEAEAVSLGGHLVEIEDAAENQWVFDTFASYGGVDRFLWIGLYDISGTFDWHWSDGELAGYFNWSMNEPNNLPSERWVYITSVRLTTIVESASVDRSVT